MKAIAREVLSDTVQALLAVSQSGAATLPTPLSEDGSPPPRPGTVQRHRLAHRTAAASAYIVKNYAAKITVAAAADQCHLSCSQFSRTFEKGHGRVVSTFNRLWFVGFIQPGCAAPSWRTDNR